MLMRSSSFVSLPTPSWPYCRPLCEHWKHALMHTTSSRHQPPTLKSSFSHSPSLLLLFLLCGFNFPNAQALINKGKRETCTVIESIPENINYAWGVLRSLPLNKAKANQSLTLLVLHTFSHQRPIMVSLCDLNYIYGGVQQLESLYWSAASPHSH